MEIVVNRMPWLFCRHKKSFSYYCMGVWLWPRAGLDTMESKRTCSIVQLYSQSLQWRKNTDLLNKAYLLFAYGSFNIVARLHSQQGNLGSIVGRGRDLCRFHTIQTSPEAHSALHQMFTRKIMWLKCEAIRWPACRIFNWAEGELKFLIYMSSHLHPCFS